MPTDAPTNPTASRSGAAFNVWVDEDKVDGGFIAYSGFAPGCTAQGETIVEVLANFADAYASWTEARNAT